MKKTIALSAVLTIALLAGVMALASTSNPASATFAGESGYLAFDAAHNIFRVAPNGYNVRALTNNDEYDPADYRDYDPAWSPEGSKIIFRRNCGIWLMDPDGRNATDLTGNLGLAGCASSPAWFPSGKKIAFTLSSGDDVSLRVISLGKKGMPSGSPTRLVGGLLDVRPAISPGGHRLAFSRRDGIYVMDADSPAGSGNRPQKLVRGYYPDWSPDGKEIVYSHYDGTYSYIFKMRPDGTHRTKIAGKSASAYSPVFSPGGRRVAYFRNGELWRMRANGSDRTRLTETVCWEGGCTLSWQPQPSTMGSTGT